MLMFEIVFDGQKCVAEGLIWQRHAAIAKKPACNYTAHVQKHN